MYQMYAFLVWCLYRLLQMNLVFHIKHFGRCAKQNKIVHIKSGNKFLVNVDKFIEFLNTGETEVESNDKESNTA